MTEEVEVVMSVESAFYAAL